MHRSMLQSPLADIKAGVALKSCEEFQNCGNRLLFAKLTNRKEHEPGFSVV